MPLFDAVVPADLLEVQSWFGNVISAPLKEEYAIAEIAPSGNRIQQEAEKFILPGPSLKPYQRIEIYNQQYWWRLIKIMQEAFPTTLRLFGYQDFNEIITVPFLTAYPPCHWSLHTLGVSLPKWVSESYQGEDKQLVHDACLLDATFHMLFFKEQYPPLIGTDDNLSVKPLYMQPFTTLLQFSYDLIEFRKQFLKEDPDFWLANPFPELKKIKTHIIFFRSPKGGIKTKYLGEVEWTILKEIEKGCSIDTLCEWIEQQPLPFQTEAEEHLQEWFGEWTLMGIFYI